MVVVKSCFLYRSTLNYFTALLNINKSIFILRPITRLKLFTIYKTSFYNELQIVGPFANDSSQLFGDYSPDVTRKFTVTPFEGLRIIGSISTYGLGCTDGSACNNYNSSDIISAVSHADLVIACLGTGLNIETEGTDRSSLDLPGKQLLLLQDVVKYG